MVIQKLCSISKPFSRQQTTSSLWLHIWPYSTLSGTVFQLWFELLNVLLESAFLRMPSPYHSFLQCLFLDCIEKDFIIPLTEKSYYSASYQ